VAVTHQQGSGYVLGGVSARFCAPKFLGSEGLQKSVALWLRVKNLLPTKRS